MAYTFAHVKEAGRMLARAYTSYVKYEGSPKQICEQIVKRCWNGIYFQTSCGQFTAFYCRDFGMCTQALIEQGFAKEVDRTLTWALEIFARHDKVTTTITKDGVPIDVFSFSCDSLPFLLHAIKLNKNKQLIEQYRAFLEKQAIIYMHAVFDFETKLVRTDGEFSSIRDHYVNHSSCYDNCMVGWLLKTMEELKFDLPFDTTSPLADFTWKDMRQQILDNFWCETYFREELDDACVAPRITKLTKRLLSARGDAGDQSREWADQPISQSDQSNSPASVDAVAAHAQIFPFYTGLFDANKRDARKWILVNGAMENAGLDDPFPMRYAARRRSERELLIPSLLAPNYEGTTVWMHLGLCYLTVLSTVNKASTKRHLDAYTAIIIQQQNFLELFDERARPYRSLFYQADESMLWAAIYLELCDKVR